MVKLYVSERINKKNKQFGLREGDYKKLRDRTVTPPQYTAPVLSNKVKQIDKRETEIKIRNKKQKQKIKDDKILRKVYDSTWNSVMSYDEFLNMEGMKQSILEQRDRKEIRSNNPNNNKSNTFQKEFIESGFGDKSEFDNQVNKYNNLWNEGIAVGNFKEWFSSVKENEKRLLDRAKLDTRRQEIEISVDSNIIETSDSDKPISPSDEANSNKPIPPVEERVIPTNSYDQKIYNNLFNHTKISKEKIYELCRDAEDSYDDTLIEGDLQYFIREDYTDTQVLIKLKGDYFTVNFRGTNEMYDIITDLSSKHANLQVAKLSDYWDWIDDDDDLYGHLGFISAVRSIYNDLVSKISIYQGKTFDMGSHSLGSALSTIFSYVYTIDPTIKEKVKLRYVITFGSPRVFYNHKIYKIERYNNQVEQIRIFNHNDMVSFVPAQDSEVISSSVLSTMLGGYGAMVGGRTIGIAGGVIGGMIGQFMGGFKHVGLGIMLMGELTHNPYEISTNQVLLSKEQIENHYKIVPKGEDNHRNPFDLISGSIFQNFLANVGGYFVPNILKTLMVNNDEVNDVMNNDYIENMKRVFQDFITGDRGLFMDYKNSITSAIISNSEDSLELGIPSFAPPDNPSHHLSSKALTYFFKLQLPKFQEFFFNKILDEVYKEGRLDQFKALNRGTISPDFFLKTTREGLISATIMENPKFVNIKLLMDRNPDVARLSMDYSLIKELILRLHGTKHLDFLNTQGRIFYNRLIENTLNVVDFRDWRNIQYINYGSNIVSLIGNLAHLVYINKKVIGHKFPSYISNIQQLPEEILRINNQSLKDNEGINYSHIGKGVYTSDKKNNEGANIQEFLLQQGITVKLPPTVENFRLHLENDLVSFRHNNHEILGFYFYENESDIKNKLIVWR